ncbi:hypothetical protein ACA081_00825, partial [Candidatus Hodgkinia cicadicola]
MICRSISIIFNYEYLFPLEISAGKRSYQLVGLRLFYELNIYTPKGGRSCIPGIIMCYFLMNIDW